MFDRTMRSITDDFITTKLHHSTHMPYRIVGDITTF